MTESLTSTLCPPPSWLSLPSHHTRQATAVLSPSLITDNEWRQRTKKGEKDKKKGRSGGQGGEESQLLWFLLPFSTTPTSECCAKGHPASMYAKRHCGYTRFKNQAKICSFVVVLIENTTVSAQVWAYPSQDVFGQWRPSELVKYAQRDEDHLRAAGHGVNAKTWWLRKRWHVEHFPRPATGSAAAASSMDTLTHQPTQTRVWKGEKKKSLLLWHESPVTSAWTHSGRGKRTWTVWEHTATHRQRLPPALCCQADRTGGRER